MQCRSFFALATSFARHEVSSWSLTALWHVHFEENGGLRSLLQASRAGVPKCSGFRSPSHPFFGSGGAREAAASRTVHNCLACLACLPKIYQTCRIHLCSRGSSRVGY